MTTKDSNEPPDPYITRLYEATKGGYKTFKDDILLAHKAGYRYKDSTPLGEKSFMAVFELDVEREKSEHEYADAFGLEDFAAEVL